MKTMRLEEGKFYELKGGDKIEVLRILEKPLTEYQRVICVQKYKRYESNSIGFTTSIELGIDGIWNTIKTHDNNVKCEISMEDYDS